MVDEESGAEHLNGDAPVDDGASLCDSDATADIDPWAYEPPVVTYDPIHEDDVKVLPTGEHQAIKRVVGYVVNPKFGLDWPEIRTLQHFAALIEHRTNQYVRVILAKDQPPDYDDLPEMFEVRTAHSLGGPAPYEVVYAWLSGFENGIHELLWEASNK